MGSKEIEIFGPLWLNLTVLAISMVTFLKLFRLMQTVLNKLMTENDQPTGCFFMFGKSIPTLPPIEPHFGS